MANQMQVGKHRTTIKTNADGEIIVQYWSTEVVKFTRDLIVLNTGGYETATTKTRMNQASNQFGLGYTVYQKAYRWFVNYKGKRIQFNDKILIIPRY